MPRTSTPPKSLTRTKAPIRPKASKPEAKAAPTANQMALNFSDYPDLSGAINALQTRQQQMASQLTENHQQLLANWVKELSQIQSQITRLKKLEGLTSAARRPIPKA